MDEDELDGPIGPVPPASQRAWRHPSELGRSGPLDDQLDRSPLPAPTRRPAEAVR